MEKYNPESGGLMKSWAMFQWLRTTLMLLVLLANYSSFEIWLTFWWSYIAEYIWLYSVMDRQIWAYNFELVRNLMGLLFFIIPSQFVFYLYNTLVILFWIGLF